MGNAMGWKLLAYLAASFVALILAYYVVSITAAHAPSRFSVNGRTYGITAYEQTQAQLEKGLMNATVTNSTFALFYLGRPGIYPFWMKDTYYPLDIIWINYSAAEGYGTVVYIANAIPCVDYSANQSMCSLYVPDSDSNYVIEAKSGFARLNGITIGTRIYIP